MNIEKLVLDLCAYDDEQEWFEFKENWFQPETLSKIFLQLHISEKSGRGVPKIIETYGREAFTFRENSIVVTIPLHRIKKLGNKVGKKVGNKKGLNARRQRIITEMRDNPNITTSELHQILGISETAVENNLTFLKENGYVQRVGSRKTGYRKVLERMIQETSESIAPAETRELDDGIQN